MGAQILPSLLLSSQLDVEETEDYFEAFFLSSLLFQLAEKVILFFHLLSLPSWLNF